MVGENFEVTTAADVMRPKPDNIIFMAACGVLRTFAAEEGRHQ